MNYRVIPLLPLLMASMAFADGPKDNILYQVRPIPPPDIKIADADRAELERGVAAPDHEIEALCGTLKSKPALPELFPDVEIEGR